MEEYPAEIEGKMQRFFGWLSEKDRRRYAAIAAAPSPLPPRVAASRRRWISTRVTDMVLDRYMEKSCHARLLLSTCPPSASGVLCSVAETGVCVTREHVEEVPACI